jgi:hypothetical protein
MDCLRSASSANEESPAATNVAAINLNAEALETISLRDEFGIMLLTSDFELDCDTQLYRSDIERWECVGDGYSRGGKPCAMQVLEGHGKAMTSSLRLLEVQWKNAAVSPKFTALYLANGDAATDELLAIYQLSSECEQDELLAVSFHLLKFRKG